MNTYFTRPIQIVFLVIGFGAQTMHAMNGLTNAMPEYYSKSSKLNSSSGKSNQMQVIEETTTESMPKASEKDPFVCGIDGCKRRITPKYSMISHKARHTCEQPYACRHEGCDFEYRSMASRKTHEVRSCALKANKLVDKFQSDVTGLRYEAREYNMASWPTKPAEKQKKINEDDMEFEPDELFKAKSIKDPNKNLAKSKNKPTFSCRIDDCTDEFSSKKEWDQHCKEEHGAKDRTGSYTCSCGNVYSSQNKLSECQKNHDLGTKSSQGFFCGMHGCNRYIRSKIAIISHKAKHSNEKPLLCRRKGCNEQFRWVVMRNQHEIDKCVFKNQELIDKLQENVIGLQAEAREYNKASWATKKRDTTNSGQFSVQSMQEEDTDPQSEEEDNPNLKLSLSNSSSNNASIAAPLLVVAEINESDQMKDDDQAHAPKNSNATQVPGENSDDSWNDVDAIQLPEDPPFHTLPKDQVTDLTDVLTNQNDDSLNAPTTFGEQQQAMPTEETLQQADSYLFDEQSQVSLPVQRVTQNSLIDEIQQKKRPAPDSDDAEEGQPEKRQKI